MTGPIAYCSGEFIPATQLKIAPQDMGFVLGVTVAEQLRTFGGKLFSWEAHKERLRESLRIMELLEDVNLDDLTTATERVVEHNYPLVRAGSDLGVSVFVTPGLYPTFVPHGSPPTVAVHSYPLPFSRWARAYSAGQRCIVSDVRQISTSCWPRHLKCRSRAHYYLADQAARRVDPNARAILLDENGTVNEASTANVVAYFANEGLVSPPLEDLLPGISLRFVNQLADKLSIPFTYRRLEIDELRAAKEIILTSTPFCVLPVSKLDARTLSDFAICSALLDEWSRQVGVDIVSQAQTHA